MAADPIFEPFESGVLRLANRIVALPVFTGYAMADGRVSPLLLKHYRRMAISGAGLVMVANVAVRADGITSRSNLRLDNDRYIEGLADLARDIHRAGAKAGLQLNHAGRLALADQPLAPAPLDGAHLAFNIAALKNFMNFFPVEARFGLTRRFVRQAGAWRQAMSEEDRQAVIEAFEQAAMRAVAAGFDIVEIHGASGYLISQFLSAFTNPPVQEDPTADLQRRLAFPLELFERVRRRLNPRVPLGWRLMVREFVPGGIDGQQAKTLGQALARAGAAYVAVSAGTFHSLFADPVRRYTRRGGYLGPDCADLRRELGIPVTAAGRIITPAVARRLLTAGQADLIGLGRPLQADPGWVHKARRRRPVRVCLDCNWCLRRVILDQGLGCARWPRLRLSRIDLARREMARLGSWLWILAESEDIHRYKHQAAMLRGVAEEDSAPMRPAVLFVNDGIDPISRSLFCQWLEGTFGLQGDPLPATLALADRQPEALVDLVRREAFGGVVLCRDPSETWRRRLVHRPRGKVVVLLGRAAAGGPILVPVDFSEAGLLQLALVRRLLVRQPDLAVDLVHVAQGPEREVKRRWASMRRIVHWPKDVELAVVPPAGDIAGTLVDRARAKGCRTVVMGKRGLSGVKRLLLGSVSAAVVSGLVDATVILVD